MLLVLPLVAAIIVYSIIALRHGIVRRYRVEMFKMSVLFSRLLYVAGGAIVYARVYDGVVLLYLFSLITSIAYSFGAIANVTWADYVADNLHDDWKPKYVALDSMISTAGALAGTAIAGAIFSSSSISIATYGKFFLVGGLIFLAGTPLIMLLRDIPRKEPEPQRARLERPSRGLYVAIALSYTAIYIPASLVAPYIKQRFGGDEMWITMINGADFLAALLTPPAWGALLRVLPSLAVARIAIAMSVVSIAAFPYIQRLDFQMVRAFVAGAGMIGLWMSLFSHMIRDVEPAQRIGHSSKVYLVWSALQAISISMGGILADVLQKPEVIFMLSAVGLLAIPLVKASRGDGKAEPHKRIA